VLGFTLDPPVTLPIADMTYTVQDAAKTMTFGDYTASDAGYTLGTLSYSALIGGSTLPTWLVFDAATLTFTALTNDNAIFDSSPYTVQVLA